MTMQRVRRRRRKRWPGVLLILNLTVAVWCAWHWRPLPSFVGQIFGLSSVKLAAEQPTAAWRIDIRADRLAKQDWLLSENTDGGSGFEIVWRSDESLLQIWYGSDRGMLLGSLPCPQPPTELTIERQGQLLSVRVADGPIQRVMAPMAVAAASAWTVQSKGRSDDLTATVHRLRRPPVQERIATLGRALESAQRGRFSDLAAAREALGGSSYDASVVEDYLREPNIPLAGHQAHSFRQWLAYAVALAVLEAPESTPSEAGELIEQLLVVMGQTRAPEASGQCMALLGLALRHAERRPQTALMPPMYAEQRQQWLRLVMILADGANHQGPLASDQSAWLACIAHGASVLSGSGRRPLPAAAPEWLATRWNVLAGNPPRLLPALNPSALAMSGGSTRTSVAGSAGASRPPPAAGAGVTVSGSSLDLNLNRDEPLIPVDLPSPKSGALRADALPAYTYRLLTLAGIDRAETLDAIPLRVAIEIYLGGQPALERLRLAVEVLDRPDDPVRPDLTSSDTGLQLMRLARIAKQAPVADVRLTKLIIAAAAAQAGLISNNPAERAIGKDTARYVLDGDRLAANGDNDGAIFPRVLAQLVRVRLARLEQQSPPAPLVVSGRWEGIVAGRRSPEAPSEDATALALFIDPAVLPIDRALATALAAQECAGIVPDWTMLKPWLGRSLALSLLIPSAVGTSGNVIVLP